jgi:hypothetical protein
MVPHVLTHGMTVGTLGLGTRAKRVLASAGIVTMAQLVSRLGDLSATGGMGRRALGQVAYELRSRALQCGGGVPNCRGCLHVGALFASGLSSPPQSQLAKLRWWNRLPLPLVQPAARRLPPLLCQPSTLSLGRAVCPPLAKGCACTQDLAERVRITIEKRRRRTDELAAQQRDPQKDDAAFNSGCQSDYSKPKRPSFQAVGPPFHVPAPITDAGTPYGLTATLDLAIGSQTPVVKSLRMGVRQD